MKRWTVLWNIAAVVTVVGVFLALADLLRHRAQTRGSPVPIVLTVMPAEPAMQSGQVGTLMPMPQWTDAPVAVV